MIGSESSCKIVGTGDVGPLTVLLGVNNNVEVYSGVLPEISGGPSYHRGPEIVDKRVVRSTLGPKELKNGKPYTG